jgi:hypothetical protein
MAITTTTLSATITANQTQFGLASTTNVLAPISTTGVGSFLLCDREMMQVTAVPVSGTVQVVRGVYGTRAVAHNASQGVLISATQADFPTFQPAIDAYNTNLNRYQGINAPVAAAAVLVASGAIFHVTGTTASTSITPPAGFVEGQLTIIADAIWTWTSTTAANGILCAGTVTTAGSTVTFTYDAATSQWYPSRVS